MPAATAVPPRTTAGTRNVMSLAGLLFVVALAVSIAVGGSTPDGGAGAREVVTYYTAHDGTQIAVAIVVALSTIPLLAFATTVRRRAQEVLPGDSVLPGVAFGAGVVAAASLLTAAGVHFTLAGHADDVQPAAAQALNALDEGVFLPMAVGVVTLVLATALAGLRGGLLPTWLGWAGVVAFALVLTPAGFFGVILSLLWIGVASVVLFRSGGLQGSGGEVSTGPAIGRPSASHSDRRPAPSGY